MALKNTGEFMKAKQYQGAVVNILFNMSALKHSTRKITNQLYQRKRYFLGLLLVISLSGCLGNSTTDFSVSSVNSETSIRTANPTTVSFALSSSRSIENAELSFSLVSTVDSAKTYPVTFQVANLSQSNTNIESTFIVPKTLEDGEYKLMVSINAAQSAQGVITQSETLMVALLNIFTPDSPEIVVRSAKLNNNSFSLGVKPDDMNLILTDLGEMRLELVLESKYKSLETPTRVSVELNLDGIGTFPLDLTSQVQTRDPISSDHHRSVNKVGKVLERIKGQTRSIRQICKIVDDVQSCAIVRKNSVRTIDLDLHLNEAAFNALWENALDVMGNVVVNIATDSNLPAVQYQLPVIYLHSANQIASKSIKSRSSTSDDLDNSQVTNSGDSEYISHTTTTSATTTTNSSGQANSTQTQNVGVTMNNEESSMATMSLSVSSGANEDVDNTQFGVSLDSDGGTIWNINESVSNTTARSVTKNRATIKPRSQSSAYNPQDEMVWTYCASEGGTCSLWGKTVGSSQVRYGNSDGGWGYKAITGSVACNSSIWGDTAPKKHKTCEYLATPSFAPKWSSTVNENQTFTLVAPEDVRFGFNADWSVAHVSGNVVCNKATFGDNSSSGKTCETMVDIGTPPLNYEYVHCAEEGQRCEFSGSAVVRYGYAAGSALFYVYNIARDGVTCNNAIAGDPLHNVPKSCDYIRYIDPNTRQDASSKIWSTKESEEVGAAEKVLVEIEKSKDKKMFLYWGFEFVAEISLSGEAGLKVNAYLDSANRTFSLIGGPYVNVNSVASGYIKDVPFGFTEVGITAPINVLDIYSPFTVALTVKPGILTAELSLDYFLDLMSGEVDIYYKYNDYIDPKKSDSQTIYHWDPLYQTTANLFKGTKTWKVAFVKDYIIPSLPDGYFKQKIGYPTPIAGRDYYLEIGGVLANAANPTAENPNEFIQVDIVCGEIIERSMTFTGTVDENIKLGSCTEVEISGIRPTSWPTGNRLTFGVREK